MFLQKTVWNFLKDNHIFSHSYEEQTLDEYRELTVERQNMLLERNFLTLADVSCFFKKHILYTRKYKYFFHPIADSFGTNNEFCISNVDDIV